MIKVLSANLVVAWTRKDGSEAATVYRISAKVPPASGRLVAFLDALQQCSAAKMERWSVVYEVRYHDGRPESIREVAAPEARLAFVQQDGALATIAVPEPNAVVVDGETGAWNEASSGLVALQTAGQEVLAGDDGETMLGWRAAE